MASLYFVCVLSFTSIKLEQEVWGDGVISTRCHGYIFFFQTRCPVDLAGQERFGRSGKSCTTSTHTFTAYIILCLSSYHFSHKVNPNSEPLHSSSNHVQSNLHLWSTDTSNLVLTSCLSQYHMPRLWERNLIHIARDNIREVVMNQQQELRHPTTPPFLVSLGCFGWRRQRQMTLPAISWQPKEGATSLFAAAKLISSYRGSYLNDSITMWKYMSWLGKMFYLFYHKTRLYCMYCCWTTNSIDTYNDLQLGKNTHTHPTPVFLIRLILWS